MTTICPHCQHPIDIDITKIDITKIDITKTEPPQSIYLEEAEGKAFMQNLAKVFGIESKFFYKRSMATGKPCKSTGKVNLSDIKKAAAYRLRHETPLSFKEIACIIGMNDHTSVIHAVGKAKEQFSKRDKKDQRFLSVFEKIKDIPLV